MSEAPTTAPDPAVRIKIKELLALPTQRDWLNICRALEAPKEDVLHQAELLLPALVFIQRKQLHGGADWKAILDLTDAQVDDELAVESDDDPEPEGKENGSPTSPEPPTPTDSTPNGDSNEPDSVSESASTPEFSTN